MTDLAVTVTAKSASGTTSASATITITTVATTINVGQTAIGTIADSQNANVIIAQSVTLPQPGALQSLSMYVRTVGGQLRLGLYSGNTPTTLIAQTAAFTPVAGWNTQPAVSAQLPAGQYWLASFSQLNSLVLTKNSGGSAYYKPGQTFGAMPATFPSAPSTEASTWSVYGTFSVVPDTTKPSVPTNLTATIT